MSILRFIVILTSILLGGGGLRYAVTCDRGYPSIAWLEYLVYMAAADGDSIADPIIDAAEIEWVRVLRPDWRDRVDSGDRVLARSQLDIHAVRDAVDVIVPGSSLMGDRFF
jgi:hypothetical protein